MIVDKVEKTGDEADEPAVTCGPVTRLLIPADGSARICFVRTKYPAAGVPVRTIDPGDVEMVQVGRREYTFKLAVALSEENAG